MFAKVNPIADLAPVCDAATTGEKHRDPRVGTFAGNYRLVARLGEGGMAAVYRGEHRDITGAVVAVKLLDRRLAATPGAARRFLREAQALFELMGRNRHIPRVLDYGRTERGESYMVMEYLRGRDLARLLEQEGPLPWPRAVRLALQLCEALAAAHARDILHRDIKPANCVLVEENGAEVVKLIDFGVAKDLRVLADPTQLGTVVGTPAYLAPELLLDAAPASVCSDIYSLGATIYRLLCNTPHVDGLTWQDIAYHLRHAPLLPPSAHVEPELPPLPPELDALVLRALDRDPGRRFGSVLEVAHVLRVCINKAMHGRLVGAARTTRRRRAFGALSLTALGVLTLGDALPAMPASSSRTSDMPLPAVSPLRHDEPLEFPEPVLPESKVAPEVFARAELRVGPERSEQSPSRPDPAPRRRALTRELNAVRSPVEGCVRRHAGNLVTDLPVRLLVSVEGVAQRVTLPATSSAGLIDCVTRAVQSRRYSAGAGPETLRHVFRFRQG